MCSAPMQRLFGQRELQSFALVLILLVTLPTSSSAQQLQPSALQQIQTLMAEKASRTPAQRKLDSHLLMAVKKRRGDALFQAVPRLRSSVRIDRDGRVEVDIRAMVNGPLLAHITGLGGILVNSIPRYNAIRARLPLDQLEPLAAHPDVQSIRIAAQFMTNKVNTSEGDTAHQADQARTTFGVDGTGVTVGVLSDGVDALAALQASGDLPMLTVLSGQAGSGSEGTAMLEIVHDLAPGADLLFATAFGGEAQFAQNILDLHTAGADVIVDDVFYFTEGAFQDDIIADAINQVTAGGVFYFSSAGNSGNLNDGTAGVWEGDFVSIAAPDVIEDQTGLVRPAHDFGGGTNANTITMDSPSFFTLKWSDPLGGASNDYDLYLLSSDLSSVEASSLNIQDGNDDPFESIDSRTFNDTGLVLVIIKFSGDGRYLHLNANRGRFSIATAGQTSGHNSALDAFGVAAVDVATADNNGVAGVFDAGDNASVETFSSDGPRRIFFESDGTPITPGDFSSTGGEVRHKPDIAAADRVSTATPGFNPFAGTSAAAPHAAAIAALIAELSNLTPSGMKRVFAASALDIEAAGMDRDSGYGIIDAVTTVGTTTPNTPPTCYVNDLSLSGIPNSGPQTFRACQSITAEQGQFDDLTLHAHNGSPGQVRLGPGFASNGPLKIHTIAPLP